MFDLARLPKSIARRIAGLTWKCDDIGMSDSTILLFDDRVLKIEKASRSSENELKLLVWLDGKVPVPKIIEAETLDGYSFLLMSRLTGEMACSDNSLQHIEDTVRALANGLKQLWQIDISSCPCSNKISEKLRQAKYNIEKGLVHTDNFNPETFSSEGFKDVSDLYKYLDRNRPQEDIVFSHGDFCLPNVFVSGPVATGFLDWGNGGVADRWQDIALCVRSLRYNYIDFAEYGENEYEKYKKQLFLEIGLEPDEAKIRYYILLDELF
ncbi:MAG: APH(3') family aminoglycoside O-phosphotransferase [Bacillota bacterium]|nr:APH(3') family aminoglycoside O-phosphotransferase [Bacillota bacterium]